MADTPKKPDSEKQAAQAPVQKPTDRAAPTAQPDKTPLADKAPSTVKQPDKAPAAKQAEKAPTTPGQAGPRPAADKAAPAAKAPQKAAKAEKVPPAGKLPVAEKATAKPKQQDKSAEGKATAKPTTPGKDTSNKTKAVPFPKAKGGPVKQAAKAAVATAPTAEAPAEPVAAPRGTSEPEKIEYISLSELHAFKNHPFQVRDDDEMRAMVESVKDKGVTQPAVVRPREGGGYELVSGHRRHKASELAGYFELPCIIRNLTDEQAITQMVEDNTNQRDQILPSERAKALKMQLEAIKHQGKKLAPGIDEQEQSKQSAASFLQTVRKYTDIQELTPMLVNDLVEKIVVHQAQGEGVNKTQELEIHYNFVGILDIPDVLAVPSSVTIDTRRGVAVEYITRKAG